MQGKLMLRSHDRNEQIADDHPTQIERSVLLPPPRAHQSNHGLPLFLSHYCVYACAGAFILITLIPANITGAIVGRHVQGGELNAQVVYYLLGIMTCVPFMIGLAYARWDTTQHRK